MNMNERIKFFFLFLVYIAIVVCLSMVFKLPSPAEKETVSNIERVNRTELNDIYTGYEYQDKKTGVCFYEVEGVYKSITFQLLNADGSLKTCSGDGLKVISNQMGYYILEDTSTGVQYIVATDLSSCFVRRNADGSLYLEEVE